MKFTNICPVFLVDDVRRTVEFYVSVLGFSYANYFDKIDNFATVYRDSVEIVLVQKKHGEIENNTLKYGNGFDIYIDIDTIFGTDEIYEKYKKKGVNILRTPRMTDYGSYEFVFKDIDGRDIGIGLIKGKDVYFLNSNKKSA